MDEIVKDAVGKMEFVGKNGWRPRSPLPIEKYPKGSLGIGYEEVEGCDAGANCKDG